MAEVHVFHEGVTRADLLLYLAGRAGPGNLNCSISVDTAPEGEGIARDDWSNHEQTTPAHALSDVQSQGGAGRRRGEKTLAELAQQHDVHPNQITDWKNQLLTRAVDVFGGEHRADEPAVDLKALHKVLGAARFSFGKADLLQEVLGVTPGSVTALAVVNDTAGRVSVVVDAALMRYETLNCHPLENTATVSIGRDDLLKFMRASGHEPRIVEIAAPSS